MENIISPDEFKCEIKKEIGGCYDNEIAHVNTDKLMEEVLIKLGYEEGIKLIRDSERWYA